MKIAFVSGGFYRADKVESWSGTPFYMRQALTAAGCEVENVILDEPKRIWIDYATRLLWHMARKRHLLDRTPRRLMNLKNQLERKLARIEHDFVFAPSSKYISVLPGNRPAAFWTDACFAGMLGFYESFANLSRSSLARGHAMESRAIQRARFAFYSSDWATASVRAAYLDNPRKVITIPFGANITDEPKTTDVEVDVLRREGKPVRIVFAGVDWKRKGGAFACKVLELVRASGVPVELDIVGCRPPIDPTTQPPWVHVHGYISKATLEGRNKYNRLIARADWLILPTVAECCAMVLAEAACYGVPSLTTDVGGNSTAVLNGETGYIFSSQAPARVWSEAVVRCYLNREKYRALARAARVHYRAKMNWDVAGKTAANHLRSFLAGEQAPSETDRAYFAEDTKRAIARH